MSWSVPHLKGARGPRGAQRRWHPSKAVGGDGTKREDWPAWPWDVCRGERKTEAEEQAVRGGKRGEGGTEGSVSLFSGAMVWEWGGNRRVLEGPSRTTESRAPKKPQLRTDSKFILVSPFVSEVRSFGQRIVLFTHPRCYCVGQEGV